MRTESKLADVPPELRLLILCSRTRLHGDRAAALRALIKAGLDWERVVGEARHHGVMPLLHRHLSRLGAPSVPTSVLDDLSLYARNNAVHNLMLSQALLHILADLREQGVQAVPYKGPLLAGDAYGDVTLRSFKDLDIIVRPSDFRSASNTLERLGYEPSEGDPDAHFHDSFVHADTGVEVELHHDVIRRRYFPTPLEPSALWQSLGESTLLGQPVACFRPEDTLLLLCLHGSSHTWQGLVWIADVSEFVRAHPALDWERALQGAARAKITRIVLLGLHLAHTLLDAPLPKRVQEVVGADPALEPLARRIVARMYVKRGPLREAVLTEQLQLGMRSGLLKLPLYFKIATFLLRPQARPLRRIGRYVRLELSGVPKKGRA